MNQKVMKILIILVFVIIFITGGVLLYKHFVTERVRDKGGMENPDYQETTDVNEDNDN